MKNNFFYTTTKTIRLAVVSTVAIVACMSSVHAENTSTDLAATFVRELNLVEDLKIYNKQLTAQIEAQELAKKDIAQSIEDSKELEPSLVPLLREMLDALKIFINNDLPFLLDERLASIADLESLMINPDVITSDRYRNIMDIYAIEMDYGNTLEVYTDTQTTTDGSTIEVDMLRIGRLALFYQTKDGSRSGMWDKQSKQWKALPNEMNRHIKKAMRVAIKQVAPELIKLPIPLPEDA